MNFVGSMKIVVWFTFYIQIGSLNEIVCVFGHATPCLHPPGRRMHKSHSLFYGPSVGCGHDRPARAATTKRKVFLKNVTTLSHNLCGAVMTAPYRQRVISFPFPEKSNHTSFFIEPKLFWIFRISMSNLYYYKMNVLYRIILGEFRF